MVALTEIALFQDVRSCKALDSQSILGECDDLQIVLYHLVSESESVLRSRTQSKSRKEPDFLPCGKGIQEKQFPVLGIIFFLSVA